MADADPTPTPTRTQLAASRDALNRQLAAADLAVVEQLEAALQSPGVAQLRAVVAEHYDPANTGGVGQQLGFIKSILDGVPSSLVHIRAGLATTIGTAPVVGG